MTLSDAIMAEDALEFIADGFSVEQHVSCYKPDHRDDALTAWREAVALVVRLGTVRKALHHIEAVIESHR